MPAKPAAEDQKDSTACLWTRTVYLKSGILHFHGENVNGFYLMAVGGNLVGVHIVHQGLYQGSLLDAAHVKAVHIVPEINLLLPAFGTALECPS